MHAVKNPQAVSSQGARGVCLDGTLTTNSALRTADAQYNGVLFRSRLEARWAVFLDRLHLRWQYEPEAFILPDGTPYAPTFLIHTPQNERRWICIKPAGVDSDPQFTAFKKAAEAGPIWPTLASGSPLDWIQSGHTFCPRCGTPHSSRFDGPEDFNCQPCDAETPPGGGNPPETNGVKAITWTPHKGTVTLDQEQAGLWHLITREAAGLAQAHRFDLNPIGGWR